MIPAGTGTTADRESTRLVEEMAAEMRQEKELRLKKEDEKKTLALREYVNNNDDDDDDANIDIPLNSTDDETVEDDLNETNLINLNPEI